MQGCREGGEERVDEESVENRRGEGDVSSRFGLGVSYGLGIGALGRPGRGRLGM